jgi:hypothetical protein
VGGEVSGLLGGGLMLLLNDEYELPIMVDATFRFDEALLPTGSSYEVVVLVQPQLPAQLCELEGAIGTVTDFDITDISITCRPRQYRVGGTLTGLRGSGLELMLNETWSLQPTSDGDITFRDVFLDEGSDFEVTLTGQPESPSQTCSISGGEGTISGGDVVDVRVTCQTNRYLVGGTVEGLVGQGLAVRLNGTAPLEIEQDGAFVFEDTSIEDGRLFEVTLDAQPTEPEQICSLANFGGMISADDFLDVAVTCAAPAVEDEPQDDEATDDPPTDDSSDENSD